MKPADAIPEFLRPQGDAVVLALKVLPRASRAGFADAAGGELRIKVTAPPVDSAANEALIELLAETLGCSRNRIEFVRGRTSRHKLVRIHGFSVSEILAAIAAARE